MASNINKSDITLVVEFIIVVFKLIYQGRPAEVLGVHQGMNVQKPGQAINRKFIRYEVVI